MALDEDDVLEVEQRIGKGDLAADPADVVVQRAPRGGVADRRVGDGLLELRQRRVEGGELDSGEFLQIGQQRRRPPQHDVGRIAVAVQYQRRAVKRLVGDLLGGRTFGGNVAWCRSRLVRPWLG